MNRCMKCMEEIGQDERVCPHCGYEQNMDDQQANALKKNTILYGRYLIGNVIGQGGFGITYVGYDLRLEMKVAVKEYFPTGTATRSVAQDSRVQWNLTDDSRQEWSKGMERFFKEAKKMARLDSVPAIVRVRDVFRENETAYIVMDFVEGVTLKSHLLGHGVLAYDECVRLLSPIFDSLEVMHEHGFIHRDISPDNIMLQPDGTVRLLDMGAAVDVNASGGHVSMAVVKRYFSAPEQYVESETVGSWTDVYAMAATIYYCLTGKLPPEVMEREIKNTPIPFDDKFGIPAHGVAALTAALELDVEKRTRTMRDFKRDMEAEGGASAGDATCSAHAADAYTAHTENPQNTAMGAGPQSAEGYSYSAVGAGLQSPGANPATGMGQPSQEANPAKLPVVILISCLVGAVSALVSLYVFHASPASALLGLAVGVVVGCIVFRKYEAAGESQKGAIGLYACIAVGSWMGLLGAIPFAILYWTLPKYKQQIAQGTPVPGKSKAAMVLCGVWFAAMLCVTLALVIAQPNHSPASSSALSGDEAVDGKPEEETGSAATEDTEPGVLMEDVFDGDFQDGDYGTVLGSNYERDRIKSVTFLDTLSNVGSHAWDVSASGNGEVMAWVESNGEYYDLYIAGKNGVAASNCKGLFMGYTNVSNINFNKAFDTENVTDMSDMFNWCKSLTSIDVSGFDTENVTDMEGMFYWCESLTSIDVSGFDTENVTDMGGMFNWCESLTSIDVSGFDTENVTDMSDMFNWCKSLTSIDVSGFDTGNVTTMSWMFYDCLNLQEIGTKDFVCPADATCTLMFTGCSKLAVTNVEPAKSSDGRRHFRINQKSGRKNAAGSSADGGGFVLEDSSSRYLEMSDLEGLSADDCRLARNEIYARHGRKFQDAALQEYFDSCDWYRGTIEQDDFDESVLNDYEIKNLDLIVAYETKKGYR